MEQKDTERTDYWERFTKTGSIADYLSYTAGSLEHGTPREDEGAGEAAWAEGKCEK